MSLSISRIISLSFSKIEKIFDVTRVASCQLLVNEIFHSSILDILSLSPKPSRTSQVDNGNFPSSLSLLLPTFIHFPLLVCAKTKEARRNEVESLSDENFSSRFGNSINIVSFSVLRFLALPRFDEIEFVQLSL